LHPNRIGRRVLDCRIFCNDMHYAADRRGGPVGNPKCTETEKLSGKWPCRRTVTGPGYCPGAGLRPSAAPKRGQGGTRGHTGPLPTSTASAARRTPRMSAYDETCRSLRVTGSNLSLRSQWQGPVPRATSLAAGRSFLNFKLKEATRRLVRGVRRAADAAEVGKGPMCPRALRLVPPWPRLPLRPAPEQ
jgi:hypothetical protein